MPFQRASHIYRLFLYWEYQLGILPKGTTYQPTSPFMKEELRKLNTITARLTIWRKTALKRWTIFFQPVKPFRVNWTR